MGPIRQMSMMRFEQKHQSLKRIAQKSKNFKNITKTLSYRHQAEIVYKGYTYLDSTECGKINKFDIESVDDQCKNTIRNVIDDRNVLEIQWCTLNNFTYRQGNALLHNNTFWLIENILIDDGKYLFVCISLDVIQFEKFTHSIIIERTTSLELEIIELGILKRKKPYGIINLNGNMHIFADTLDVTKVQYRN